MSVTEMADLLFNNQDSLSCYAAHKLLTDDKRFFKQVGRKPPFYTPRGKQEMEAFCAQIAAEQKVSHSSHHRTQVGDTTVLRTVSP